MASSGGLTVSNYARRLKALADNLADTGNPIIDRDLMIQLLHGLTIASTPSGPSSPLPDVDGQEEDGGHRSVLAPQTGPTRLPPTWILLTIQGTTPREAVVLAIRTDNVYIVGFKNAAGVWFAFPAFKRLIKGSTPLPKGLDYRSLVGSYGNLKYLHINRSQVLQDVRFLSTYRLPSRPDMAHNAKLGSSLARLCVVVTETARFKMTNAMVVAAMDEQGGPSRITEQETKLVVIWGVTSKSLLEWPKYGCPKMPPK
ncbi:ribosome-inactivating protein 3-like [Triticum aestivum]|uniref:ribosome-inactivating protein 3-like n=1 Tax=Triticum aestivum TaxID=4565 RepID=UPI001D009E1D|nr:ribosome-inactivating protein 3-like [Triticum aestivum]